MALSLKTSLNCLAKLLRARADLCTSSQKMKFGVPETPETGFTVSGVSGIPRSAEKLRAACAVCCRRTQGGVADGAPRIPCKLVHQAVSYTHLTLPTILLV
eukprot:4467706-Amphidinium_carterae.1